jgi:hypothetical protein
MNQYNLSIMDNQKEGNVELQDLMHFILQKYTKEEIDWYLSLVPQSVVEGKVYIQVVSNSYANEN